MFNVELLLADVSLVVVAEVFAAFGQLMADEGEA